MSKHCYVFVYMSLNDITYQKFEGYGTLALFWSEYHTHTSNSPCLSLLPREHFVWQLCFAHNKRLWIIYMCMYLGLKYCWPERKNCRSNIWDLDAFSFLPRLFWTWNYATRQIIIQTTRINVDTGIYSCKMEKLIFDTPAPFIWCFVC